MPTIHRVTDAERAHAIAIKLAKYGFVPKYNEDSNLSPLLVNKLNLLCIYISIDINCCVKENDIMGSRLHKSNRFGRRF